jgi:hypothetical protein
MCLRPSAGRVHRDFPLCFLRELCDLCVERGLVSGLPLLAERAGLLLLYHLMFINGESTTL